MKKRSIIHIILFVLLTGSILLSACTSSADPTPTAEPVAVQNFAPVVSSTGEVVPEQRAMLSITTGGVVAEVLVSEGDAVKTDQVLIRLEGTEQLQAAVSAAEFEHTSALLALNALYNDLDLQAAVALQAREGAEQALDDLLNPELQQALALEAIANAEKAVETAARQLNMLQSPAGQADIDAAKAQVILAEDALGNAQENFEPYENKPEDNLVRANSQAKLSAAQQAYDSTVRRLNALQGTGSAIDVAVAEANYATAQAQLIETQRDWERVKDGPSEGDIALLETQIAKAQRDYETYSAGPDPDQVTLAEARIANAETQVAAAQAAVEDLELRAPFDGTISDLFVNSSEWIAPGQPVALLADLTHLRVETTDLGEIDVAQIEVGGIATVTFDALPDIVTQGTIVYIAPKSTEGAGVNYTVMLELNDVPAGLRWGMTAFVDIEIE